LFEAPGFAQRFPKGPWIDPCAGDGAIIKAVSTSKHPAWAESWTTIELRASCRGALGELSDYTFTSDALKIRWPLRYNVCLTNPPYHLAFEFLQKALDHCNVVAFLLRLSFLGSGKRAEFLQEHTPSIFVLPNRPSFVHGRTDNCEYAWFVWGFEEPTVKILGLTPKEGRQG
jgi:hypothetical protein